MDSSQKVDKRGVKATWAIIAVSIIVASLYGKVPASIPNMIEVMGLSYTTQGLMMTFFALSSLLGALFGGGLIDRFGPKRVIAIGLVITLVGNGMGIVSSNETVLLASRFLEGVGFGIQMTSGPVIISSWYPIHKRGIVTGAWGANIPTGILISLGIGPMIIGFAGWKGMWIYSFICVLIALILVLLFVQVPRDGERQDAGEALGQKDEKHGILWGYFAPLALMMTLMFLLQGSGTDSYNTFSITYVELELGYTYEQANFTLMCGMFGQVVGGFVAGLIFVRFRDKGLLLAIVMLLNTVAFFIWFNMNAPLPVMYAVAFISGCVICSGASLFFAIAPLTARSQSTVGAAVSLAVIGQQIGAMTGPFVIGMILDTTGYNVASIVMGCMAAAAFLVGLVLRAKLKKANVGQSLKADDSQESPRLDS